MSANPSFIVGALIGQNNVVGQLQTYDVTQLGNGQLVYQDQVGYFYVEDGALVPLGTGSVPPGLSNQVATNTTNITTTQNNVGALSTTVGGLSSAVTAATSSVSTLTSSVSSLSSSVTSNNSAVSTLSTSVGSLNSTVAGLQNLLTPIQQTYAQLVSTYPAASYPGVSAYTSDVGNVVSDGSTWSLPTREGVYSLLTAVPSGAYTDRYPIGIPGQESSVWYANGQYNLIYTNGAAHLAYAFCSADPTVAANWSSPVEVVGGGLGGQASTARHSYIYIEGGTLYCYYVNSTQDVLVATAPATFSGSPTFSAVGTVLAHGSIGNGNGTGNCCVCKSGSTYYLFQEALSNTTNPNGEGSTNSFQIWSCTSTTATGTFTVGSRMTSLLPGPNGSASGADVKIVGSTAVMFYHGNGWGRLAVTDLYRATMPTSSLGTDAWVITQGQGAGSTTIPYNPWFAHRAHYYEFDQLGDAFVVTGPNGIFYLFYEGANNRIPAYNIMITPLIAPSVAVDGSYKHVANQQHFNAPWYWDPSIQWTYQGGAFTTGAAKKVGTWALDATIANAIAGGRLYNSTSAQNDSIEYDVNLPPGTYTLTLIYEKGADHAIHSISFYDGYINAGPTYTVDGYAASTTQNNVTTVTMKVYGFEVWRFRLLFKASTRNASNTTGWVLAIQSWHLQRTGD